MFKFRRVTATLLAIIMVFCLAGTAFAQNADVNQDRSQLAQKYTVDDIKALEPYVSVEEGHFKLDVEQAKKDNVDIQLIEGQLKYFDILNDRVDAGDIKIEKDLTIINNESPLSALPSHWPSCGGGINTGVTNYWWGYSRYACDCETRRMSADFDSCSSVAGGIALIGVYFGPIGTIPAGLTSSYFWLLSSRLDANNHGYGVYMEMTWLLAFDIAPQ